MILLSNRANNTDGMIEFVKSMMRSRAWQCLITVGLITLLLLTSQLQTTASTTGDTVQPHFSQPVVVTVAPQALAILSPTSSKGEMTFDTLPVRTVEAPANNAASNSSLIFQRRFGYNPSQCKVQPNTTEIDPYKGCPLPGLNNMLFTQVNRWYCAVRDNRNLHLRDRTCNKGSQEPFRFSTILQVRYDRLKVDLPGRPNAALCWSDISKQDKAPSCEWRDIPSFYGTELWWKARRLLDFHDTYYEVAHRFVEVTFDSRPFLAVHLRRGDYQHHCTVIKKKGIPPWISFATTKKLFPFDEGCYPSVELVQRTLTKLAREHSVGDIFVATNTPNEFASMAQEMSAQGIQVVLSLPDRFFSSLAGSHVNASLTFRSLDKLIVEMAVLSMGHVFLLNRYSSLSGIVFEMAVVRDKVTADSDRVLCW